MQTDPRNDLLLGAIATQAAIHGGQREVYRVWLDRDRDDDAGRKLRAACKHHDIRYSPASKDALAAATEKIGGGHGGVVAEVGTRKFVDPGELFEGSTFLAMLDGVEDPFNFGQAVRSLYAAGCTGLFVRQRNWTRGSAGAAAVIARASAGATERIAMAVVDGPEDAAELAEPKGFMVAATGQSDDAVSFSRVDFRGPTLLMIGGERRGLRRSFLAQCEAVVAIPYGPEVKFAGALGTVAATSVLAFEIARQRGEADVPTDAVQS
ncbi:MAG: TrmH family RNA methyltransferase [Planctomycetota bacterium]